MPRVSLSSAMARHKNINSLIDMLWANKGDVIEEAGALGLLEAANFQIYPTHQKNLSYNIKTHLLQFPFFPVVSVSI